MGRKSNSINIKHMRSTAANKQFDKGQI